MSDGVPTLPGGVILRYVRAGDVEIECPGCGEKGTFAQDPVSELLQGVRGFIDAHAGCWCPVGRGTEAPYPA